MRTVVTNLRSHECILWKKDLSVASGYFRPPRLMMFKLLLLVMLNLHDVKTDQR